MTYEDSHDWQSLINISITCKAFRDASLGILFKSINITYDQGPTRRDDTILELLSECTSVAEVIQNVSIWDPEDAEWDPQQFRLLQDFLRGSSRLKSIEISVSDRDTLPLVREVCARNLPVQLTVQGKMTIRKYNGDLLEEFSAYQNFTEGSAIGLNLCGFTDNALQDEWKRRLVSTPCLRALTVCLSARRAYLSKRFRHTCDFRLLCMPASSSFYLHGLEEFHASDDIISDLDQNEMHSLFRLIIFRDIRRLSLSGPAMVGNVLPLIASQLVSLQSLRLNTSQQQSYAAISGLSALSGQPTQISTARDQSSGRATSSLLLRFPLLRELTLDGPNKNFSVKAIATPQLEHLRLHMRDTFSSRRSGGQRSAADIRLLSTRSPNIKRLELDIGDLNTLWHGSAIPGVDVDVHTYHMLKVICSFPKLQYLRLYPRYVMGGTDLFGEVIPCQPLSDEQAVRLFRRLKSDRPCLQVLSITADPFNTTHGLDFDCMSWLVSQRGKYTILRTRQATKSYEQEQVWEGERRLSMQIKRDTFPKKYHTEKAGWMFDID